MREALDNQTAWLKGKSEVLKQYKMETECCGSNSSQRWIYKPVGLYGRMKMPVCERRVK